MHTHQLSISMTEAAQIATWPLKHVLQQANKKHLIFKTSGENKHL